MICFLPIFSIRRGSLMHLFLCLYYQVVSHMEYHRRVDALNSEDLRSLCKRLQVPLYALPGSAAVCTPTNLLQAAGFGAFVGAAVAH